MTNHFAIAEFSKAARKKTIFFILQAGVALLMVSSCVTKEVENPLEAQLPGRFGTTQFVNAPKEFRAGLALLDQQSFEEAYLKFDEFLRLQPTSPWSQASLFYSARALEELSRWTEASERYRRVLAAVSSTKGSELKAMALFRLSYCHEALGDNRSAIASLSDLSSMKKFLPPDIAFAELPGRLAAVYARIGNFEAAVESYKKAERGIQKLRHASVKDAPPDWLPRTLYSMGSMSMRTVSWDEFEEALRPLARSQIYLLQAAELNIEPWSQLAAGEVMKIYSNLWKLIETADISVTSSDVAERRAIESLQWSRAALLQESAQELKARFLPHALSETLPDGGQENKNKYTAEIFDLLKDLDKKVAVLFERRPFAEGLTPEAIERRSQLRGRAVSEDDSLERKFLKESRNAELNKSSESEEPTSR